MDTAVVVIVVIIIINNYSSFAFGSLVTSIGGGGCIIVSLSLDVDVAVSTTLSNAAVISLLCTCLAALGGGVSCCVVAA